TAIDASTSARSQPLRRGLGRHIRAWSTVAAAAVLLIAVGVWRGRGHGQHDRAAIQLARGDDVHIDSIEASAHEGPMVISTCGDQGIQIIWVVESEQEES